MRLTLNVLGFELDVTLGPAAADEPAAMDATTDRGYFTSQPISFVSSPATPAEWQPPERTQPWDEPDERGLSMTVTHEADHADLVEAIMHHNATAMRCPRHWTARLAALHEKINALLTELEAMDRGTLDHRP